MSQTSPLVVIKCLLFPSTRKCRQSLGSWKRMGHPPVLLSSVRGKLPSLRCTVFTHLFRAAGSFWLVLQTPEKTHRPISVQLSKCSFLFPTAAAVSQQHMMCVWPPSSPPTPPFPLLNSHPTLLSTPIPLFFLHVVPSITHTVMLTHCCHMRLSSSSRLCVSHWRKLVVCVCVFRAAASLQHVQFFARLSSTQRRRFLLSAAQTR